MSCNCDRDGNVEYIITLNAQGPQGLNGPVGQDGFSPKIDIYENTNESYKLSITTTDGTIITPNLKANITTLDNYVTLDTTQTIGGAKTYMVPQNFYDGIYIYNNSGSTYARLSNDSTSLNISPSSATTVNIKGKLFAANGTSDNDLSPVVLAKNISGDDYINVTNNNGTINLNFNSNKIDLSNYVTLNTAQTITARKTFSGGIAASDAFFTAPIYIGRANVQKNQVPTLGSFVAGNGIELSVSSDNKITIINTAGGSGFITNVDTPLSVDNGTLKLAVDNQTIQVNAQGQLACNLDELGNEVNTLSGRVTTLEGDVNDLSGEVAGNTADIATIRGSLGNNLISKLTATEYSNLTIKDSNTLYIVVADDNSNFTMYYGEIPMYMPSGSGDNASQKTYVANIATTVTAEPYTA